MAQYTRREVLRAGAGTAMIAMVPRPLLRFGDPATIPMAVPPIEDPDVKELALAAVAAAREAGATYADVRLTHTYTRTIDGGAYHHVDDAEGMHVGVRALADGYWGFATSPVWTRDEMARLGRAAVLQAKANVLGVPRSVELAPAPKVADGHWETSVQRDPFKGSPLEIQDFLSALVLYGSRFRGTAGGRQWDGSAQTNYQSVLQEKAFASTEGSYCTQRLVRSGGNLSVSIKDSSGAPKGAFRTLDFATFAALGWELFPDQATVRAAMQQTFAELLEEVVLPGIPLEVGRYDTVLDARSVAAILSGTFGRATELDRALGYEANAGGTSYINNPLGMVGNYQAAAETVTVTANRTEPGGCATVQWDDEGVAPDSFPLIKDGVLNDFPTTRESATWLQEPYGRRQQPVRSHGCAAAPTAREAPLLHPPNLVLVPGRENQGFTELVGTLQQGIAIREMDNIAMDFQALNGATPRSGGVRCYSVKNGKIAGTIAGMSGLLFRAPELWKGVLALGGAQSARRFGFRATKGEPVQEMYHSVTAPPAVFKQLTLIDLLRR